MCFDLDGTLADSAEGVTHSLIFALNACGIDSAGTDWQSTIGPPLPQMLANALPGLSPATRDRVVALFRDHYSAIGLYRSVAFPGVESLLRQLTHLGYPVCIVTNKPQGPAEAIVRHLKLEPWVSAIVGGDPAGVISKPQRTAEFAQARSLRQVTFIGDGLDDLHAAERINGRFVLAAWGYGAKRVLAARPDVEAIDKPEDFLEMTDVHWT